MCLKSVTNSTLQGPNQDQITQNKNVEAAPRKFASEVPLASPLWLA